MTLRRLLERKQFTVLGINSGTSADGIDLAAVAFEGRTGRVRFLDGAGRRFPKHIRRLILEVGDSDSINPSELVYLDRLLGKFIGRTAARYMEQLQEKKTRVALVASHGQTVRHLPHAMRYGQDRVRGTLQLGSLDEIAAATGSVVAGDFRQADIAAGGEGAPITTDAMHRLFADKARSRLIVNIGGIANYFYFPKGRKSAVEARDCGPGNSLCDILSDRLHGEGCDRGGRRAASGTVSQRLLSLLLAMPFYQLNSVSTGRELFGPKLVERMIRFGRRFQLGPGDLMATAAELTTLSIAVAVGPLVEKDPGLDTLYLMGGGRHNRHFVRRLKHHLPDLNIAPIDKLGVKGDLVEAAAFAVMGIDCLHSVPAQYATAARSNSPLRPISGHLVQPPVRINKRTHA